MRVCALLHVDDDSKGAHLTSILGDLIPQFRWLCGSRTFSDEPPAHTEPAHQGQHVSPSTYI